MTDTLAELDAAIQRHIGELFPGAVTGSWILVTAGQRLEDGTDGACDYRLVTPEAQPVHVVEGLLRVGERIAQDSWDSIWFDSDEEDDD